MNWITTNLRLPEDLYMELKMEAAKKRKSVAAIIRVRLWGKKQHTKRFSEAERKTLLGRLKKIQANMAKETKGVNLTQALIDMRYEQ